MPKISELDSPSIAALKAKAGTTTLLTDLAGKAPIAPAFLVVGAADGTLPNERRLVAGTNITITDNGANSTLVVAATGGSGTVTSVGASPSGGGLTITGGPITGSGSLTFTLSSNLQAWHALATSVKVDVSALAGATGDGLVGFQQTGTGTVARTLAALIDDGYLYGRDFGVVANGTTDDTAALQAAITSAIAQKRELVLPAGVIKVTSEVTATGVLRMRGAASGNFAYGSLAATAGTTIQMVSGTVKTHVLQLVNSNCGGYLGNLVIDANSKASVALDLKSVIGGIFNDVYAWNGTAYTMRLWCNPGVNTMHNTFTRLHVNSPVAGSVALFLTGQAVPYDTNTCHNVFINTEIDYAGAASQGLLVGNSDNNIFYQTFVFSPNSTEGFGVSLYKEFSTFPIGTGFYHLQAGPKGMFVDDGLVDNYVYGYAQDNAQPDPVWNPALSRFFYVNNQGRHSRIWSVGEISTESGQKIRFNGVLTGNTWMSGTTVSMDFSVNGVTQASFGTTAAAFAQRIECASDICVTSGNRIKLNGAANLHGIRWSSPNIELFAGASFAAGFGTNTLGFCGTSPIAKPTVTGAKSGNAALASLLTQLAAMGLITDSST